MRMIHDISGPMSEKPLACYDHASRSWRTFQDTETAGSSEFLETVPKTGFMSAGALYALPTSALLIDEIGYSSPSPLLPTPTARDYKGALHARVAAGGRLTAPRGSGGASSLPDVLAADVPDYDAAIEHWARSSRPAPARVEPNKNGKPRPTVAFYEWLMGLPDNWVDHPDIPYGAKIKMCGNGAVPQQAALALKVLGVET